MEVRFLGHSAILIKGEYTIVVDPFHVPVEADLVLLTHDHYDHRPLWDIPGRRVRLSPGGEFSLPGLRIKALPAHDGFLHPKGKGVGYLITMEGWTLFHAGDTSVLPEHLDLAVDWVFFPVHPSGGSTQAEAIGLVREIRPKFATPIHWGVLPESRAPPILFEREVGATYSGEL